MYALRAVLPYEVDRQIQESSPRRAPDYHCNKNLGRSLKALTSLNNEVRLFFLSDDSIWSFPSVSSLSDYSIGRS